jgi:uncharacterized protein
MADTDTSTAPAGDSLAALLSAVRSQVGSGERRLPPVDSWNPPHCGDIGLEIRADGSWWHEGVRITRQPLVELFATILRKDEDGQTYLVTPGEKVVVHVADAHFRGVRVDRHGSGTAQVISMLTNVGDLVAIGPACPLRVAVNPATREPRPYVRVRGRLDALLTRPAFYELADWGEERDGVLGVWSSGQFFKLDAVA